MLKSIFSLQRDTIALQKGGPGSGRYPKGSGQGEGKEEITDKMKVKASEEFKVGDVLDPQGKTNMVGKVTIREITGNTLKFTDSEGTDFSGMQRSQVRELVNGGSWKKEPSKESNVAGYPDSHFAGSKERISEVKGRAEEGLMNVENSDLSAEGLKAKMKEWDESEHGVEASIYDATKKQLEALGDKMPKDIFRIKGSSRRPSGLGPEKGWK
jgi:hypothetical protein